MSDDEPLDYSPSSGATSETAAHNDHRAPESAKGDVGATTFDPDDVEDSERFEELRKRHHEHFNQVGSNDVTEDVKYDTELVCSRLDCTPAQTKRIKMTVYDHRSRGRRYEVTILAAVRLVLNKDGRWIQRDHERFGDDCAPIYAELMDTFDVTEGEIRATVETLREEEPPLPID